MDKQFEPHKQPTRPTKLSSYSHIGDFQPQPKEEPEILFRRPRSTQSEPGEVTITGSERGVIIDFGQGIFTLRSIEQFLQKLDAIGATITEESVPGNEDNVLHVQALRYIIEGAFLGGSRAHTHPEPVHLDETLLAYVQLDRIDAEHVKLVVPMKEREQGEHQGQEATIIHPQQQEQRGGESTLIQDSLSPKKRGRPPIHQTAEEKQAAKGESYKRYAQSEKGRARLNHYDQSEQGKARHKRYTQSEKGKQKTNETKRRYREKKKQQTSKDIFVAESNPAPSS